MQPKYIAGSVVRIVHRTLGEQQATIVKCLPASSYLIIWEGHEITVHERFISEF